MLTDKRVKICINILIDAENILEKIRTHSYLENDSGDLELKENFLYFMEGNYQKSTSEIV